MPRSKTVVPGRTRRKKVLKAAKGGFSGRSKLYKTALQTQQRAG
jgi:ribosomal protein L20